MNLIDETSKCVVDLDLELQIIQGVIDQQDNIVFVLNKDNIITVNQSFFDFFRVSSIENFIQEYDSVLSTFIRHEKFFSELNVTTNWVDDILSLDKRDQVVSIVDLSSFEPRAFTVQINKLSANKDSLIITLTDITSIRLESEKYYYHETHDALTEQFNRSYFINQLSLEMSKQHLYDENYCMIQLDIDNFKTINYTQGYEKADKILQTVGRTIFQNIRPNDVLARWSGAEFIILLNNTNIKDAEELAKLLRGLLQDLDIEGIPLFTASFGVVQSILDENENTILKRLDIVLQKAKQSGKNKVVVG